MDSSTSRVVLAVLLCGGILFAWEAFVSKRRPQRASGQVEGGGDRGATTATSKAGRPEDGERERGSSGSKATGGLAEGARAANVGRRSSSAEGELTTLEWPAARARLSFSDRGATLRHAVLLDGRFKETRQGKLQQVDLVQTGAPRGPWPLVMTFPGSEFELPPDAEFELRSRDERSLRYVWQTDRIRISKGYVLDRARPIVWLTLQATNLSGKTLRQRLEVELFSQQGSRAEEGGITNPYPRRPTGLCYVNGELERRSASSIRGKESGGCGPRGCGVGHGELSQVGQVRWIGTDDRYFMTALVPLDDEAEQLRCAIRAPEEDAKLVAVALDFPEGEIQPGATVQRRFAVYLGPKDLQQLDAVKGAGGAEVRLSKAIEFGWFSFLSRPMLGLMKVFERVTGNWGLAIILLTLLVKLITLYWSTKSMRSMRQMQRLKPKIDELRERFKDDKQRLNQEMMSLYKVHRVSPLGGCLPMVIQMPIWFALYSTLGNAQELYRSGFLGWISDLTASDPYYVLPVAVGLAMFAQQAISPQPVEAAQAKMMKYAMPVMFSAFMMWLPAGLTIYILVNTVLTMVHQWYINRTDPMPAAENAAAVGATRAGERQRGEGVKRSGAGAGDDSKQQAGRSGKARRRKKSR